jgi:hypothetical protein
VDAALDGRTARRDGAPFQVDLSLPSDEGTSKGTNARKSDRVHRLTRFQGQITMTIPMNSHYARSPVPASPAESPAKVRVGVEVKKARGKAAKSKPAKSSPAKKKPAKKK